MKNKVDPLIEQIIKEANTDNLGMILVHKGLVRSTSKDGTKVKGIYIDFSEERIKEIEEEFKKREGIEVVKILVNKGKLNISDEIMTVIVAGRFRKDVIPTFEEVIKKVKENIKEKEIF